MVAQRLYMDWNATAPLLPEARDACVQALDLLGNPSSVHKEGRAVRMMIEAARRDVAALCGASASSVIFTSGATEAANMVLSPDYRMGKTPLTLGHLYVSAIEHPAMREGGRFPKAQLSEIPVTAQGIVDIAALAALLDQHDRALGLPMVAIMMANNETGVVQPIAEAAALVKSHGGLLVVDAVQAAGRLALDIEALGADFLILSSHKLGGPKGAGALVCRGEILMPKPLVHGGGQEKGHRSGTENPVAIAGFAAAACAAKDRLVAGIDSIAHLRDKIETTMRERAPDVMIHGVGMPRIGNTSFFTLPGLKSETGQIAFDLEGVALSAGAACSSGKVGQSHVLTAMGLDADLGGLRLSIGPSTKTEDADRFLAAFEKIASRRKPVACVA